MIKTKEELYLEQIKVLNETSNGVFSNVAFVDKNFICPSCGKDLLTDTETLKEAMHGYLITGCPFCYKSFCE